VARLTVFLCREMARRGAGSVTTSSTLVDDHSRLAYAEILPDEKGPTYAGFFDRALGYFGAQGIVRVERLMTDNAWAYRYPLHGLCTTRDIQQIFIRPHCPGRTAKQRWLNRTLLVEWAHRRAYTSKCPASRRPCPMAGPQHWPSSQHTRRAPARQPAATNLTTGYTLVRRGGHQTI
jgi:hypothetical protein